MQEIHIPITEPQLIWIISLPITVVFLAIATSKSVRETIRSLHDPTLSLNTPTLLVSMFLAIAVSAILVLTVDLAYLVKRDLTTPNAEVSDGSVNRAGDAGGDNENPAQSNSDGSETFAETSCSAVLFGSSDRCWKCSKGFCCDGHLEGDGRNKDNYCVFEWECPECGYLQKSKYKINLRYSVAGTPLSHHWRGGEIPRHASIEQRRGIPFGFGHVQSEGDI